MPIHLLPIESIEGIGPAIGDALRAQGMRFVADLTQHPAEVAIAAAAGIASEDQVYAWRSMAAFLLCDGMTPQWAEALVLGGIDDFGEFLSRDLERLTGVFSDAVEAGRIEAAPTVAQLFDLAKGVGRLSGMAIVQGRVVDSAGEGIAAAAVRMGPHETQSNELGDWLLAGLEGHDQHVLSISAEGYSDLLFDNPPQSFDVWNATVPDYTLEVGDGAPLRIDEFDGDAIPTFRSYRTVQEVLDADALREGDALFVSRFYVNGDVKLSSVFRAYERGDLIFRAHRMPRDSLPDALQENECLTWRLGTFTSHGVASFLQSRLRDRHIRAQQRDSITEDLADWRPFERMVEGDRRLRAAAEDESPINA